MTREEAINLLDNLIGMVEDNQQNDYDEAFKPAIKSLKSWDEDVAPVVHGEWIAEEIHNCWTEFECSVCKFKHKSVHNFGKPMTEFNYCPNCGADMRERREDG